MPSPCVGEIITTLLRTRASLLHSLCPAAWQPQPVFTSGRDRKETGCKGKDQDLGATFTLALAWSTRDQIPESLDWSLTWGSHLVSQLLTPPPFTFSATSAPSHCPPEQRAFPYNCFLGSDKPGLFLALSSEKYPPPPPACPSPHPVYLVSSSGLQAYVQRRK